MKISSFEPGCFDTVRSVLPCVEVKSLTSLHNDMMEGVRRALALRKYDSASEAHYLQGAMLKRPESKAARPKPTAVEVRRMAAWDHLHERVKEQRSFVTSERGQERACQDLARQDATTSVKDLVQVATRAIKSERMRVEAYCDEFEFLAGRVTRLCQKSLPTTCAELVARIRHMKRLLQQCDTLLQQEASLVQSLQEQAQSVVQDFHKAQKLGRQTVEIAHAFSRPGRHILLTTPQEQASMYALYVDYMRQLGDLELQPLPLARRAIKEALDCIDRSLPGRGVPRMATSL